MAHDPQHSEAKRREAAAGAAPGPGADPRPRRPPSPAAERALAEAAARRAERDRADQAPPEEGGRRGPDPARYGDWEVDGRAVDF